MNHIKLRMVNDNDAQFLFSIMNDEAILDALKEVPTQLCDWEDAIKEWKTDQDEEDYIICDSETPIGWLGINGLCNADKTVYLKLVVIRPCHHCKGIGTYSISQIISLLKCRNYQKIALYTDQENRKAQACYKKCGFTVTEALTEEMSNGEFVARYKMELVLE